LFNPVKPVGVLTPDFWLLASPCIHITRRSNRPQPVVELTSGYRLSFVFCNLAGKDAGQNNTKLPRGLIA
jgi:hypothetical protein